MAEYDDLNDILKLSGMQPIEEDDFPKDFLEELSSEDEEEYNRGDQQAARRDASIDEVIVLDSSSIEPIHPADPGYELSNSIEYPPLEYESSDEDDDDDDLMKEDQDNEDYMLKDEKREPKEGEEGDDQYTLHTDDDGDSEDEFVLPEIDSSPLASDTRYSPRSTPTSEGSVEVIDLIADEEVMQKALKRASEPKMDYTADYTKDHIMKSWQKMTESRKLAIEEFELRSSALKKQKIGERNRDVFLNPRLENALDDGLKREMKRTAKLPRWMRDFYRASENGKHSVGMANLMNYLSAVDKRSKRRFVDKLLESTGRVVGLAKWSTNPSSEGAYWKIFPSDIALQRDILRTEERMMQIVASESRSEEQNLLVNVAFRRLLLHAAMFTSEQLHIIYEFPPGDAYNYPQVYLRDMIDRLITTPPFRRWMDDPNKKTGFFRNSDQGPETWLDLDELVSINGDINKYFLKEVPTASSTLLALQALQKEGSALEWSDGISKTDANLAMIFDSQSALGDLRDLSSENKNEDGWIALMYENRVFKTQLDAVTYANMTRNDRIAARANMARYLGFIPRNALAAFISKGGAWNEDDGKTLESLEKAINDTILEELRRMVFLDSGRDFVKLRAQYGSVMSLLETVIEEFKQSESTWKNKVIGFIDRNKTEISLVQGIDTFIMKHDQNFQELYSSSFPKGTPWPSEGIADAVTNIVSNMYPELVSNRQPSSSTGRGASTEPTAAAENLYRTNTSNDNLDPNFEETNDGDLLDAILRELQEDENASYIDLPSIGAAVEPTPSATIVESSIVDNNSDGTIGEGDAVTVVVGKDTNQNGELDDGEIQKLIHVDFPPASGSQIEAMVKEIQGDIGEENDVLTEDAIQSALQRTDGDFLDNLLKETTTITDVRTPLAHEDVDDQHDFTMMFPNSPVDSSPKYNFIETAPPTATVDRSNKLASMTAHQSRLSSKKKQQQNLTKRLEIPNAPDDYTPSRMEMALAEAMPSEFNQKVAQEREAQERRRQAEMRVNIMDVSSKIADFMDVLKNHSFVREELKKYQVLSAADLPVIYSQITGMGMPYVPYFYDRETLIQMLSHYNIDHLTAILEDIKKRSAEMVQRYKQRSGRQTIKFHDETAALYGGAGNVRPSRNPYSTRPSGNRYFDCYQEEDEEVFV